MARKYDDDFWMDLSKNEVGLWKPSPGRETVLVDMLMDDGVSRRHAEIVVYMASDHGANEVRKALMDGVKMGSAVAWRKIRSMFG